jgi:hypothetical protein
MDVKPAPTPAEMKLRELKNKEQIASEVNPSLKDITTIKRRIANLKSKLLIQEIEKVHEPKKDFPFDKEPVEYIETLNLDKITEHFDKIETKIQLRLQNL